MGSVWTRGFDKGVAERVDGMIGVVFEGGVVEGVGDGFVVSFVVGVGVKRGMHSVCSTRVKYAFSVVYNGLQRFTNH